ncbi:MAG TPA: 4-hydroxyphenylpyruvate dioxygenase [Acidimicrobiia bacterium]|nr:4-hydroxyphenylpyruvate dioxygenase [Acidimicrobiia bacterium]
MSVTRDWLEAASAPAVDAPRLGGIDHIEFWVGNARAAAAFFASCYGFEIVAYAGPETGVTDRVSYVLTQGDIRFVVTAGIVPSSPIVAHVAAHGDGVRDVAFLVDNAAAAYGAATARGATGVVAPHVVSDASGRMVRAGVATYGETRHSFIERDDYLGLFAPGYDVPSLAQPVGPAVGLTKIDHVVGNVELGNLGQWVDFYARVFGFEQMVHFDDDTISTEYSALMSTVVWDGSKVVLPINEPAEGRRKSQIEEYLDWYGGPGVQHIALRTDDIVATVRALRDRGVRFLRVPAEYYDDAKVRMAGIDLPWEALADLGILADRDQEGHLLQVFTENMGDRPTLFFEIIQREGARGFGAGNFKALFEAIEREQERRGNL